ncbi:MAG: carboxyl transferase domain-containing protein, partial [Actinomycetota bacterium]
VADGTLGERRAIAISFEFAFIGGSMGVAEGERICRAFELAACERLPVITLTATGGARMQEGMLALAQMPATIAARARLAGARAPFIAYLRNPTTGGVYASFASTADVILAEPGATIGFAGPRVAETFTGQPLPPGSHTAEWARDIGLVARTIDPLELKSYARAVLDLIERRPADPVEPPPEPPASEADALTLVQRARSRPAGQPFRGEPLVPLAPNGTVAVALADVGGHGVVAIATATNDRARRRLRAHDYGNVRRGIATATRLGIPVVTFVDTPGSHPSSPSEASGGAREIAATFDALLRAPVPTVAVITGEGGSGGALALAACDRVLIQEGAFFSVIAPEGAATILKRSDVDQVARDLRLTAHDLRRLGLADRVIPDGTDGVAWALSDIAREGAPTARRLERWRAMR